MSSRHSGFIEFLADLQGQCGGFSVVARKEQEHGATSPVPAGDFPITEIMVDENDNEICMLRNTSSEKDAALKLGDFYQTLSRRLEQYPNYSLMVSEYFRIDEEHTGRVDIPLSGVEIDESDVAVRLLF